MCARFFSFQIILFDACRGHEDEPAFAKVAAAPLHRNPAVAHHLSRAACGLGHHSGSGTQRGLQFDYGYHQQKEPEYAEKALGADFAIVWVRNESLLLVICPQELSMNSWLVVRDI